MKISSPLIVLIALAFLLGVFLIPPNQPASAASSQTMSVSLFAGDTAKTAAEQTDFRGAARLQTAPAAGEFTVEAFDQIPPRAGSLARNSHYSAFGRFGFETRAYPFETNPFYLIRANNFDLPPNFREQNFLRGGFQPTLLLARWHWRNRFGQNFFTGAF